MRPFSHLFLLVSMSCLTVANAFPLMKDGVPACFIAVPGAASPASRQAADELALYLAKISGGSAPSVADQPAAGLYPVRFVVDENAPCQTEGYVMVADETGLTITAKLDLGLLYGVYNLLKETTGIRWVFPGADGEYFTVKPSIDVPALNKTVNPSFPYRSLSFHAMGVTSLITDTWNWMLRNGLRINAYYSIYTYNKSLTEEYDKRAAVTRQEPAFSLLLGHGNWATAAKNIDKLWEEHPEYFPIINGKRTKLARQAYQPCTTHPEVIQRSADSMLELFMTHKDSKGITYMYNDDGTGWCQCDNCRKIDTPRDISNGWVSNRYWTFANAVAKKVLEKNPNANFYGLAYQNFMAPPEIPVDPRMGVQLSYNRVCYRHNIDDPICLLNPQYNRFYKGWAEKGIRVIGREELATHGNYFQPAEKVYSYLLRYYSKMGLEGTEIAIAPPDGNYGENYKESGLIQWRSMWQTMYIHALYLWNVDADFETSYEEINSLYYGLKAWNAGMRDFRHLLLKAASETPGCFGHGFSAPLGRCLDQPGVREKLIACLDAAEKAAAQDSDPRALQHVQFDRQRFSDVWLRERDNYLKNYREIHAYQRTSPITIDAVLDEADWKNADIISNFKLRENTGTLARYQTFVRIVHEPEYLYFGMEMLDPSPDKLRTAITERDGAVWEDNTVEIFLTHPDMGASYFHFIVNAAGTLYDRRVDASEKGDKSFNSSLDLKSKILDDRWLLEMRIPTSELGEKCFLGQSWKINVLRARAAKDHKDEECSTLSGGAPFDTGTFMSVAFADKRKVSAALYEGDSRAWINGSFNEPGKLRSYFQGLNIKDDKVPSGWGLSAAGEKSRKEFAWLETEPGSGNFYMRVNGGVLSNDIGVKAPRYRLNYKYRGKGQARFYVYRYDQKNRNLPSKLLHTLEGEHPEWSFDKLEFDRPGDDNERQVFSIMVNGEYDFDDVYLSPIAE